MAWNTALRRRIKLRDLDTLLMVGQCGSMAKAASQLSVSQPAVSKAIADMEMTLGVRLLERTAQGVEPTPYGRSLLKCSEAVFDDLRQGINEIGFLNDPTTGEVRIGATEPAVAGILPAIIALLARRYPRMVFNVTQIPIVASHRELHERTVDLAVGRIPDHDGHDDLDIDVLFDDPQNIVAGRNNPWTRRSKIKLKELIDEPWTLPHPENAAASLFAATFREQGLGLPRTRVLCNSVHMHTTLLARGPFLAVFPRSLMHFAIPRLAIKVLPVELSRRPMPFGIVTLKNRMISPAVRLFIETAREVAKPLAKKK